MSAMNNKAGYGASMTLKKGAVLFRVIGKTPPSIYLLHLCLPSVQTPSNVPFHIQCIHKVSLSYGS